MTTSAAPHLFWITSRAAGIAALVLSSFGVSLGLSMGSKLVRGRRVTDVRTIHEALSLATLVALVVHAASLLGDSFLHPTVLDLTIPFWSSYMPLWNAMGLVAGWGLLILGLSFYARKRIGQARWKTLHRFTALAWLLGIGHSLGEGTDAGTTWFLAMTAIVVIPPLCLLVWRMTQRPAKAVTAAQVATPPAATPPAVAPAPPLAASARPRPPRGAHPHSPAPRPARTVSR